MERGLVEHLDEPAISLCLYGFLCIFGIQYIYGKSSSSSLVSIPNEVSTDLWLSSTSNEEKSVRLYVGFPGSELKLVRTPLNVHFTAFKSIFLSLYAHITSDECHAWFHLNAASLAVRNAEQVNIIKNSYPRLDSNHQYRTSCIPACPSNHSATETVDNMRLELLQYLFTLRYYKYSVPCAKGYRENENKIIAYLQFCDWYHFNTRWLTQKKKFIMSYVSMTISTE